MNENYTRDIETVTQAEESHIRSGRGESGLDQNEALVGLALSGGGIRSASFCLGILQALVNGGLMKKVDYLSTASGGGYLGSSLTWFLKNKLPDGRDAGTDPDNFPFGKPGYGARNQENNRNSALDYLRQHGQYLTPGKGLDFVAFTAFALRTILVSLLIYFSLLTIVFMGLNSFDILFQPVSIPCIKNAEGMKVMLPNLFILAAIILIGFFILISLLYNIATRTPFGGTALRYYIRVYNQIALGLLLKLAFVAVIIGTLPLVHNLLASVNAHIETAGASTVLGSLMGWFSYYRQQRSTKTEGAKSSINTIIAASLIVYGLLLGAYILAGVLLDGDLKEVILRSILLLAVVVIFGWFVNINYASLHRVYRDRLMEAFTPDIENVRENKWGYALNADKALIEDMCQSPNKRPYHIINTNLVLANSPTTKYRGRGGDSFIMSPLYCGSDATGWRASSDYMKKSSRGMTLPTAMAISGAALNPNAGNNGRGATRNRWVSILYTLLNLRLGYWAINPAAKGSRLLVPNFIIPALTQSILGKGLKEDKIVIELTDGGHFDNLALYEMIRRKLKTIIVCDGGADPNFTFDDLANAIERVRVDFGAKIAFDDLEYGLCWVQPGSAEKACNADQYATAKRGFAVGNIYYADGSKGNLIYIKATITHGLSTDVYSYKSSNPTFPHEPTLDQFFDEVQIEAYRELGYYLGWQMLEANSQVSGGEKITLNQSTRWV